MSWSRAQNLTLRIRPPSFASALVVAAVAGLACGGGSSNGNGPSSTGCAALEACCNAITNPSIQGSCNMTLSSDQSLPDSDQTCQGNLVDYQGYCGGGDGGAGEEGGTTEGGPTEGGGGGESAAPLSLGFTPSNLDLQGITGPLPDVDVKTTDCTIDASSGSGISCANMPAVPSKTVMQNVNGVSIVVYYVKTFKIESSAVLKVSGNNPVAIVALDTIDIEGLWLANGSMGAAIAGGANGMEGNGGGGPSGNGGGQASKGATNGNPAGGAGGGGYCMAGGTGGSGPGTGSGTAPGGIAWGTASIVPLAGGASGGGNGYDANSGPGGGAVQLDAATSITIGAGGAIHAGGGGGTVNDDIIYGYGGGPGGGSGGSILLESPVVTVAGTLAANGGGGAGGTAASTDAAPGAGADATANTTPAQGGTASGTSTGGAGAAGSSGPTAGESSTTYQGGGGGGSAGRIRINTKTGSASLTGTVSPAVGACVTQGSI